MKNSPLPARGFPTNSSQPGPTRWQMHGGRGWHGHAWNWPLQKIPWHTIMLFVCHPNILHEHCFQFLLGVKMAPTETENNAYAKFWGDKQRALWYVMVFSGVVSWLSYKENQARLRRQRTWMVACCRHFVIFDIACEQALCLRKKIARKGKGKGGGKRARRQTFEAAIPPSCNYPAHNLSVRSLSLNQFRALGKLTRNELSSVLLHLKTEWNGARTSLSILQKVVDLRWEN